MTFFINAPDDHVDALLHEEGEGVLFLQLEKCKLVDENHVQPIGEVVPPLVVKNEMETSMLVVSDTQKAYDHDNETFFMSDNEWAKVLEARRARSQVEKETTPFVNVFYDFKQYYLISYPDTHILAVGEAIPHEDEDDLYR